MCKEINSEVIKDVSTNSSIYEPFTLAELVDVAVYSRNACKQLPSESEIHKNCSDKEVGQLIIQGARAIRFMAGEAGQPEPEEAQAMYVRFVQLNAELDIATMQSSADTKSCIGTAQSEKKDCQKNCSGTDKKFCGCFWNSFLAKSNCFLKVGVSVP